MDLQDWTPVIVNKKRSRSEIQTKNVNPDAARLRKIENEETFVKPKMLSHESLKKIVSYRIENKLSQSDLDSRCGFPRNTIQLLESHKIAPSTKQLQILNRILKTGLTLS
jgi:ribosome-binding protein aMBF1 (putative translation factor)